MQRRRGVSFLLLVLVLGSFRNADVFRLKGNRGPAFLQSRRICRANPQDPLDRLQQVTSSTVGQRKQADLEGGSITGGVGGAVLGGLLLGPFGAVFGASLGSRWGRKSAEDATAVESLGLDKEMIQLAQRVATDLASMMDDRARVVEIRDNLKARVANLEREMNEKYLAALEALKIEEEVRARSLLEDKQKLQKRLQTLNTDLQKAESRLALVDSNLAKMEKSALEVASLLERAKAASTTGQRISFASEASALGMNRPRDPLLDKFEKLERGER